MRPFSDAYSGGAGAAGAGCTGAGCGGEEAIGGGGDGGGGVAGSGNFFDTGATLPSSLNSLKAGTSLSFSAIIQTNYKNVITID